MSAWARRLAPGIAVALLATIGLTGCTTSDSEQDSCDVPKKVPQNPVPAESAPGGGGIQVLEHGFNQLPLPDEAVSIGAMLHNTSNKIAYRTKVTFHLFDSAHTEISTGDPGWSTKVVPIILPGQRIGVGGSTSVQQRVASVTVQLGTTTWLPQGALGSGFVTTDTKYLRTIHYDPERSVNVSIHYIETMKSCQNLDNRGTAVVFRDAQGRIVGGDVTTPDMAFRPREGVAVPPERRPPSSRSCTTGQRETWITPPFQPSEADDNRTTMYSYCDLNAFGDYTN